MPTLPKTSKNSDRVSGSERRTRRPPASVIVTVAVPTIRWWFCRIGTVVVFLSTPTPRATQVLVKRLNLADTRILENPGRELAQPPKADACRVRYIRQRPCATVIEPSVCIVQ
jgi:hypothetical protein